MGLIIPDHLGFNRCGSPILPSLVWLVMLGWALLAYLMPLLHSQQKLEYGIKITLGISSIERGVYVLGLRGSKLPWEIIQTTF